MLRFGFPLIVEPHFSSTNRAGRGMTTFCAWRPSQRRLRMISNPPFAMYRRHLDQCPLWAVTTPTAPGLNVRYPACSRGAPDAHFPPKNETARAVGAARDGWMDRGTDEEREGAALSQDHGVQPHARQELSMSNKPISPLRQRMIDDMRARRFSEDTQKDYVRNVRNFAAFLGRSPDTATKEDLRRFQLHMAQQQISPGSINAAIAALRFFFTVTLERPDLVRPLRIVTEPRRAPVVLSQEEVARLLEAAPGLKYKAALSVAYGAGLRVSELANLKVSDIDSQRMTLRVEQGQGAAGSLCDALAAT